LQWTQSSVCRQTRRLKVADLEKRLSKPMKDFIAELIL